MDPAFGQRIQGIFIFSEQVRLTGTQQKEVTFSKNMHPVFRYQGPATFEDQCHLYFLMSMQVSVEMWQYIFLKVKTPRVQLRYSKGDDVHKRILTTKIQYLILCS